MKSCQAVTLALFGWYLMVPPWGAPKSKDLIDDGAPLSQWKNVDSFDYAYQCREAREGFTKFARKQMDEELAAHKSDAIEAYAKFELSEHARCIATNDPRLKEK